VPSGRVKAAVAVLGALVISEPDFAAENWPDFVDHYIEQVRKTIDTAEMDGRRQKSEWCTAAREATQ
jgi:hypothetical protein